MRKWFSRSLLVLLVFIVVWAVMIAVWNERNQMPDTEDVVLYLVVLPIALIVSFALGARMIRTAVAAPPAADEAPAEAPPQEAGAGEQERGLSLSILASALRMPFGQSAEALDNAIAEGTARPDLDPELTDANGYPVLAARAEGIDEEEQRELLNEWHAAHGLPELRWSPEQLRALALVSEVVTELAQEAMMHPKLGETRRAAGNNPAADEAESGVPTLQLLAALPADWDTARRQAAGHWLLHLIEQQGWPREKMVLGPVAAAGAPEVEALALADRLSLHVHRQGHACLAILVACESHIADHTVAAWESAKRLHTTKNDSGRIPGEGAAGLLLADASQAELMGMETVAQLHRVARGRRDKSADAAGRISADLMTELAQDAMTAAGVAQGDIRFLAADTDHRPSRMAELLALGSEAFPDLDAKTQCRSIGAHCGHAPAVAALAAIVLAHEAVLAEEGCALCISNGDAHERAAVIVKTRQATPAEAADAAEAA